MTQDLEKTGQEQALTTWPTLLVTVFLIVFGLPSLGGWLLERFLLYNEAAAPVGMLLGFTGINLLVRGPHSLQWARFWLFLFAVAMLYLLAFDLDFNVANRSYSGGPAHLSWAAFSALACLALGRPAVRQRFATRNSHLTSFSRIAWTLALAGFLSGMQQAHSHLKAREKLESLYGFTVTIKAINAASEQALPAIVSGYPESTHPDDLVKVIQTRWRSPNEYHMVGTANGPFVIHLQADGYQEQQVTISRSHAYRSRHLWFQPKATDPLTPE